MNVSLERQTLAHTKCEKGSALKEATLGAAHANIHLFGAQRDHQQPLSSGNPRHRVRKSRRGQPARARRHLEKNTGTRQIFAVSQVRLFLGMNYDRPIFCSA